MRQNKMLNHDGAVALHRTTILHFVCSILPKSCSCNGSCISLDNKTKTLDRLGIEPRTPHKQFNLSLCEASIIPLDHMPI